MRLRAAVISVSSLMLISGCGGSGDPTVRAGGPPDPSAIFLPMAATAVSGSAATGHTGLFVVSSQALSETPKQITTEAVASLGIQATYALSAQGMASVVRPRTLIYTTVETAGGNHVWSLDLSGTSSLVPIQLSNLAMPGFTTHIGPGANPVTPYCVGQAIPKSLSDPNSSTILILAVPTDATFGCNQPYTGMRWVLVRSSDGPTTNPVELPTLSGSVLPLYRPDGALAGLVAVDAGHHLNFYPDETLATAQLLLANVAFFTPEQEAPSGSISTISANPTYSFLVIVPAHVVSGPSPVYRVDYTGSISADLYDSPTGPYNNGAVVDSNNLYLAETLQSSNTDQETIVSIPGGGGTVQVLGSTSLRIGGGGLLASLVGISGSHLVFTGVTPQHQGYVQTLPTNGPGTFTTIASDDGTLPEVALAGGDIFVTWARVSLTNSQIQYSTQILDDTGKILQDLLPSSSFVSQGAPLIQVRNITDSSGLGGGGVYLLDLSQPSSPSPMALKTTTGAAFTLPTGLASVYFTPVTATVGVADRGASSSALVYDLSKALVVPVSIPNSNFYFMRIL